MSALSGTAARVAMLIPRFVSSTGKLCFDVELARKLRDIFSCVFSDRLPLSGSRIRLTSHSYPLKSDPLGL